MEFKWIEDFICLSQYGSFAKAAKSRYITQPAFSRRIKALEEWIGIPLVNRDTYPATFTKAGFNFLKSANNLKQQIEDARRNTLSSVEKKVDSITFHTQHALSEYVINKMLKNNSEIFNDLLVNVIPSNLHDSTVTFLEKKSDYLISLSFKTPRLELPIPDIESAVIGTDSLVAVTGINDNGDPFYQDEVGVKVPMLSYPPNAFLAQVIEKNNSLAQANCLFNTVYINNVSSSLKSMAISGHGVTWLPLGLIQEEIDSGELMIFSQKIKPIDAKIKIFSFPSEKDTPNKSLLWKKLIAINI